MLYQSPLGNVPGALAGLVLAHTHHLLLDRGFKAEEHPVSAAHGYVLLVARIDSAGLSKGPQALLV